MALAPDIWQRYAAATGAERTRIEGEIVQANIGLVMFAIRATRTWGNDDALSDAMGGMLAAIRKFDPARGYLFSTYAMTGMTRNIRRYAWARRRRTIKTQSASAMILARIPERHDRHAAIDARVADVLLGMPWLDARERWIVRRRWLGVRRWRLSECGEVLGLTRERIRQIERRAFLKLRAAMEAEP